MSIGNSSKALNPTNTGKFGVGFNSIYHVTDTPSILSSNGSKNKQIFFLNPLRNLTSTRELGWEVNSEDDAGLFTSLLGTFTFINLFDDKWIDSSFLKKCSPIPMSDPSWKGTVFRFPLRCKEDLSKTNDMAVVTKSIITKDEVMAFFTEFKATAQQRILFLHHIQKISFFSRDASGVVSLHFSVSVNDTPSRSSFFISLKQLVQHAIPSNPSEIKQGEWLFQNFFSKSTIQSQLEKASPLPFISSVALQTQDKEVQSRFILVPKYNSELGMDLKGPCLSKHAQHHPVCLLPYVCVALDITAALSDNKYGGISCTLPINNCYSGQNGLYIDGRWELDASRKHLHIDDPFGGKDESKRPNPESSKQLASRDYISGWFNYSLLANVVIPAFIEALQAYISDSWNKEETSFYCFHPILTSTGIGDILPKLAYRFMISALAPIPVFLHFCNHSQHVSLRHSCIIPQNISLMMQNMLAHTAELSLTDGCNDVLGTPLFVTLDIYIALQAAFSNEYTTSIVNFLDSVRWRKHLRQRSIAPRFTQDEYALAVNFACQGLEHDSKELDKCWLLRLVTETMVRVGETPLILFQEPRNLSLDGIRGQYFQTLVPANLRLDNRCDQVLILRQNTAQQFSLSSLIAAFGNNPAVLVQFSGNPAPLEWLQAFWNFANIETLSNKSAIDQMMVDTAKLPLLLEDEKNTPCLIANRSTLVWCAKEGFGATGMLLKLLEISILHKDLLQSTLILKNEIKEADLINLLGIALQRLPKNDVDREKKFLYLIKCISNINPQSSLKEVLYLFGDYITNKIADVQKFAEPRDWARLPIFLSARFDELTLISAVSSNKSMRILLLAPAEANLSSLPQTTALNGLLNAEPFIKYPKLLEYFSGLVTYAKDAELNLVGQSILTGRLDSIIPVMESGILKSWLVSHSISDVENAVLASWLLFLGNTKKSNINDKEMLDWPLLAIDSFGKKFLVPLQHAKLISNDDECNPFPFSNVSRVHVSKNFVGIPDPIQDLPLSKLLKIFKSTSMLRLHPRMLDVFKGSSLGIIKNLCSWPDKEILGLLVTACEQDLGVFKNQWKQMGRPSMELVWRQFKDSTEKALVKKIAELLPIWQTQTAANKPLELNWYTLSQLKIGLPIFLTWEKIVGIQFYNDFSLLDKAQEVFMNVFFDVPCLDEIDIACMLLKDKCPELHKTDNSKAAAFMSVEAFKLVLVIYFIFSRFVYVFSS